MGGDRRPAGRFPPSGFRGRASLCATMAQGKGWGVEVMKPACDYTTKKRVTLEIESHHGIA